MKSRSEVSGQHQIINDRSKEPPVMHAMLRFDFAIHRD
jgi:hypothetical protein